MRISAPRLASFSNFLHQNPSLRFKSLSSLAQVSAYNSDSHSDEQSSHNDEQFVGITTFRVTEMIHKLSAEPTNAYSLFHQLKSSGFKHDLYTYLSLIRVLCHPKMSMNLDSVLREVILYGKSDLGFEISDLYELLVEEATKEDAPKSLSLVFDVLLRVYMSLDMCEEACENFVETLFQTREKEKGLLHIGTVNHFMNWLVVWNDGEKIDLVLSIYEELKKRPLNSPDLYTYGIVIKANLIKGYDHAALAVLEKDMTLAGVTPSAWTYTIFIEAFCKTGKTKTGYENLQYLRSKENIQFDVYAYKVIIGGFVREGNFEKAELIMNEIEELGLVVDQDCYRILIQGYCGIRDIKRGVALHNKMLSKGIDTNCVTISTILQCLYTLDKYVKVVKSFNYYNGLGIHFDAVPFIIVMNAVCKMRRTEEAMGFIIKKMDLNVRIYTSLMNSYFISKKPQEACKLFVEMRSRVKLDEISYRCLTYGLSRTGGERRIKRVLDDMESQGLEPSPNTHKRILEGLCTEGKVEEAKDYMSAIVPDKTPDICAAMVNGCLKSQDKDDAYYLFLMFSHKKLLLTRSCYLKLLKLLCDDGQLDAARQVYKVSIRAFPISCKIMHRILVEALCQAGDIKEARQVFNSIMEPPAIEPDVSTYNIMLKGYCSKNLMRHADDFFEAMQNGHVKPDVTTYTVLIDKYYNMGRYDRGDWFFRRMKRAGFQPDKAMYQTRIRGYLKRPHIHKVVFFFNQMSRRGMYPDESTVRMIRRGLIKACGIHRRDQTSEECYTEMRVFWVKVNPWNENDTSTFDQTKLKSNQMKIMFYSSAL